jgi:glycine cleavage system H protein
MKLHGMDFPDDLAYDHYHGWMRVEGNVAVHGVTDLGQRIADKIAFVGLPSEQQEVSRGQTLASFESAKWVDRVLALVSGRVLACNQALEKNPGLVNLSPYGEGWIARVEMSDPSELNELMRTGSPEFTAYIEEASAAHRELSE